MVLVKDTHRSIHILLDQVNCVEKGRLLGQQSLVLARFFLEVTFIVKMVCVYFQCVGLVHFKLLSYLVLHF